MKLVGNYFSRLKRNLESFRSPFMADMATIGSRLVTSKMAALNLVMNSQRDSFSFYFIPISMSDVHL